MPIPRPNTDHHRMLLTELRRDMRNAENALSTRHAQWRRSERSYRLYVDPNEVMGLNGGIGDEAQLLHLYPTSVVVPLSYAMTQTIVAFWVSLYTADPLPFHIDPADPNSVGPARAQELLLKHQLNYWGYTPLLYSWLTDACKYGIGVVKNVWEVIERNQTVRRYLDFPGPNNQPIRLQVKEKRPVVEFEGNAPEVVDPFQWRPDARWPLSQFQRGSYCGEAMYRSTNELKMKEAQGIYHYIADIKQFTSEHFKESSSDRDRIMNANHSFGLNMGDKDALVLLEEVGKDIVPSMYGLDSSKRVERWVFTLANRSVIIRADPYPYDHNDFTYAAIETSPDFHSLTNPGVIEIMEPLHQHITWLVNSNLENARKVLNDRLVIDPSIVNMDDVLNPSAGKTIRINEAFWGVPGAVKNGVQQLNITDLSSANTFKHIDFMVDLLQRISAANETLQGQVQSEERTATEINNTTQMGAQRLRVLAQLFSACGLTPLARQMVANNQQLMTQETYFKIIGSLERDFQGVGRLVNGGSGLLITPEDIQGQFSFPVADASQPLDPVRYARTWVQVMQVTAQQPQIAMGVDMLRLWMEMVKSLGIQDPARFLIPQMQVMPDQMIQQQVQAGNLVPAQGQQPVGMPPPRMPIPQQQQPQSIQGEENRPQ